MTCPVAQDSKPITLSFCSQCPANELSVRGLEINVESRTRPNTTLIGGVPSIYQEDIVQVIRDAGVIEGTCSVKVDLTTKKIVFLSSSPWQDHQCAKVETFEEMFKKALANSKSKK